MTRFLALSLLLLATSTSASASCDTPRPGQAHAPLMLGDNTVSFIFQPVFDEQGRALDSEGPQIVVYFREKGKSAVLAGELPYLATTGRIEDAFVQDIDHDNQPDVIVIHSAEVRSQTDFQGPFYSVLAFTRANGSLTLNERVSRWFGSGGDTSQVPGGQPFPYKTRASIQAASGTSLFDLSSSSHTLTGTIGSKAFLYNSPVPQDKTRKYLVKGDKVTIEDATAGWCKVTYAGNKKPLQMWTHCSAIRI